MYYRCTKKIDLNCHGEDINEKALEELLEAFITANADKTKVERHYVVAESLADYYKVAMKLDEPLIKYARCVLTKGSFEEKAGLTKGINNKLYIKDGTLALSSLSTSRLV